MSHRYRWLLLAGVVVALLSGCLSTLPTNIDVSGPLPATLPPLAQTLRASAVPMLLPSASVTVAPVVTHTATAALIVATPQPPTVVPPTPTIPPAPTLVLPTLPSLSPEERWRAQQLDRQIFDPPRLYNTKRSELYWYDPVNQQKVLLGILSGDFMVQATFTFREDGQPALEVPYEVNRGYGITALSPAVLERIRAAGYSDWIETFVLLTHDVQPN